MDLYYIDYISVSGTGWLHKVSVGVKMAFLVAFICVLLWLRFIWIDAVLLAVIILAALTARLPLRLFFALMLYPVVFLVIVFLSVTGLNLYAILLLTLRVLTIAGAVVAFFLSTSYPRIFGALSRVLPGFLVAALFFTYRSIFAISESVNNIRTALHLRGGISLKQPRTSLKNFGQALGHMLVDTIDSSERKAESLRVRGFANRVYYLDKRQ